jgi:hypothetical protein
MRKSYSIGRKFRRTLGAIASTLANGTTKTAVAAYEVPRDFVLGFKAGDAVPEPVARIAHKRRKARA